MKSYYIDSENVKLHVLAADQIDGKETILFLHGYPDTSSSWEKQFEYFKDKYRVAAFDLRGIIACSGVIIPIRTSSDTKF